MFRAFWEARSLDRRWRAGTASEAQGPVFVHPGGIMQQDTEPMSVPMAMAVDVISSGRGGQRAGPGYGSTTIDAFQTVFPAAIESSDYRSNSHQVCEWLRSTAVGPDAAAHTKAASSSHKTVFHPLWASTIEEASVDGNLLVHDDVYLVQLKRTPEDLDKMAIPTFNDQSTNARIRGGQQIRRKDFSHWERREIFQLGFGSFHLTMNLLWCVLETHRGTLSQTGSLTQLFAVLEKTRLGGEHPDYHTLLASLTQILHGLILDAWRNECDYPSLRDFAKAEPTPGDLPECARRIVEKYASVEPVVEHINPKAPPKDLGSGVESTKPVVDIVRENTVLLTRDLLLVTELVDVIATGDFGRVEDILPALACMFRGSGSNNYSMEILHLIFNIKEVWTPADIMRDNMLVNPSGLPGHAMGIDMNIEHLIRYLKVFSSRHVDCFPTLSDSGHRPDEQRT
ncbi:hypothetical protein EDB83DRAFT_2529940 [Lactarius deliciosus]|nr:hypothetical protein EDB83DRAFT_2529940 [Lactarius deliciosus]